MDNKVKLLEYNDGSGYTFYVNGDYPEEVPPYFLAVIEYFNNKLEALQPQEHELVHRMKEIMVLLDCDAKQALEIIKFERGI